MNYNRFELLVLGTGSVRPWFPDVAMPNVSPSNLFTGFCEAAFFVPQLLIMYKCTLLLIWFLINDVEIQLIVYLLLI